MGIKNKYFLTTTFINVNFSITENAHFAAHVFSITVVYVSKELDIQFTDCPTSGESYRCNEKLLP